MLAADFAALVLEVYAAASVRTRALRAAGVVPDADQIAEELAGAMTGVSGREAITEELLKKLTGRVVRRWGIGFAPAVGAVYAGWDAEKTVALMAGLPTN